MQTFSWRGRNGRGELISGTLDGADDAAVADQLLAGGVTPVLISAAGGAAASAPRNGVWQALGGAVFLDERVRALSLIGIGLVIAGAVLASRRERGA
jgi:MSHA biogenesis protein MshG